MAMAEITNRGAKGNCSSLLRVLMTGHGLIYMFSFSLPALSLAAIFFQPIFFSHSTTTYICTDV
ncbi:hypothetical protein BJX62DRAFT_195675 [Aspergillus germanicus]